VTGRADVAALFGATLRRLRHEEGLTQEEVAARLEGPVPGISRFENGHAVPDMYTVVRLARALRVPLYDLVQPLDALVEEGL
jgi:transcriptional regulator with XRE-family HTH domain